MLQENIREALSEKIPDIKKNHSDTFFQNYVCQTFVNEFYREIVHEHIFSSR